ncbi:MAG: hypothetical protein AB1641_09525 [Thermodesulfobacteriota bacterium]
MKSILTGLGLLVVILAVTVFWAAPGGAQKPNPKALFEEKCSRCHETNRALIKTKTLDGWKDTVKRMMGKKNAAISKQEAELITQYLFGIRGTK